LWYTEVSSIKDLPVEKITSTLKFEQDAS